WARLSLVAMPNSLREVAAERLIALPYSTPSACASLLLNATPPIVAETDSLSARATPPRWPRASALALLTARPRSAVATERLSAAPWRLPLAVAVDSARPPLVAPAIDVARLLPVATAVEEALPPLVAMETAVASPAKAAEARLRLSVAAIVVRKRFTANLLFCGAGFQPAILSFLLLRP